MAKSKSKFSQFGDFYRSVKGNPIPMLVVVAICVVGGAFLGRHGTVRSMTVMGGSPGEQELPTVDVRLGSVSLAIQYAKTSVTQDAAWLHSVAGRPAPTLLEWETPGRYPVLDVHQGWVVVWVRGGKVIEVRTPPERLTSALIPEQACRYALILPASQAPQGGTAVTINQQAGLD